MHGLYFTTFPGSPTVPSSVGSLSAGGEISPSRSWVGRECSLEGKSPTELQLHTPGNGLLIICIFTVHITLELKLKDVVCIKVDDWYNFGLQLNIDDGDLETIKKNNPNDTVSCKRDMFRKWLNSTKNPSFKLLVDALVAVGELREATHLSKKYSKLHHTI